MRASHTQRLTISLQHCCFGIGALVAPLFVRASQGATSSFHAAFWAFSFILCCSALSFLFLPSPSPPHDTSQHDDPGFIAALRRMSRAAKCLLFSVALLLGVCVGCTLPSLCFCNIWLGTSAAKCRLAPICWSTLTSVWASTRCLPTRPPPPPPFPLALQTSGPYLTDLFWY